MHIEWGATPPRSAPRSGSPPTVHWRGGPQLAAGTPGGHIKNTHELLNLRALKFSPANKIYIFQCMGKIFCAEFQRYPLKFHTKNVTHTLKDMILKHWNFKRPPTSQTSGNSPVLSVLDWWKDRWKPLLCRSSCLVKNSCREPPIPPGKTWIFYVVTGPPVR